MEPKEVDFNFPRGDTCPIHFTITDKAGDELNLEKDIDEIYFTMKKNYRTAEYILQKKYSRGEITVEGKDGVFILEHEDTATLKYGKYVYDIQLKSGDYVKTLALGEIELTNESTYIENE